MSRSLEDLTPEMRALTVEFLARLVELGLLIMLVDTLRTPEEQEQNILKGVSWTKNSRHLPQEPSGKSDAIDLCPYSEFSLHGPDKLQWNGEDPVWEKIGEIGESLGLEWGGRWKQRDLGHFKYNRQKLKPTLIAQSNIPTEHWGES